MINSCIDCIDCMRNDVEWLEPYSLECLRCSIDIREGFLAWPIPWQELWEEGVSNDQ
jgi:hypothetical protein